MGYFFIFSGDNVDVLLYLLDLVLRLDNLLVIARVLLLKESILLEEGLDLLFERLDHESVHVEMGLVLGL